MHYSEAFKRRMVQKMCGPDAISGCELSRQEGISQASLSRWKRQAATLGGMKRKQPSNEPQEITASKRPQDWTTEQKLQAVLETSALSDKELGAYLRRKGLHEATLQQWRALVNRALGATQPKSKKSREHKDADKRVRKLERDLKRKNAALAETAALLVLKKKAQAIWGAEDDDTDSSNGR